MILKDYVVLLLDVSGSMATVEEVRDPDGSLRSTTRIAELNRGLASFLSPGSSNADMASVHSARGFGDFGEIAIGLIRRLRRGESPLEWLKFPGLDASSAPFVSIPEINGAPRALTADGQTPMVEATMLALDALTKRINDNIAVPYRHIPVVILITDGEATDADQIPVLRARLEREAFGNDASREPDYLFFALGIAGANFDQLRSFAPLVQDASDIPIAQVMEVVSISLDRLDDHSGTPLADVSEGQPKRHAIYNGLEHIMDGLAKRRGLL